MAGPSERSLRRSLRAAGGAEVWKRKETTQCVYRYYDAKFKPMYANPSTGRTDLPQTHPRRHRVREEVATTRPTDALK